MTYPMTVAGLRRDLPICKVTDDLYIGAFIVFGDAELTVACARELLKLVPAEDYDYMLTAEAKSIPLIHEMARQSGAKKYFIARKGPKAYMPDPIHVEDTSITTAGTQRLYLGRDDAELIRGKRILLMDDVISTGGSLHAMEQLVALAGGTVTGRVPSRCRCGFCSACLCCTTSWWRTGRKWAGLSMTGCRRPAPCAVWRYCRTVRWLCGAGIRRRGEYVRRFGDRDDGHLLRSLFCIFAVSPYLMKTRNIAQNYIRDAVEIARAEQDITQKRAAGMEHFGLLHVRLAVYVRTDLCPGPGDRGEHDRQKGDVPGHGHQAPVRPIGHGGRGLSAVQCQSPGGEERLGGHLLRCAGRRVPSGAGSAAEILGVGPAGQRLLRLPAQLHHPSLALPRVAVHYLHGLTGDSAHLPSSVRFRQCAGILVFRPEAAGV